MIDHMETPFADSAALAHSPPLLSGRSRITAARGGLALLLLGLLSLTAPSGVFGQATPPGRIHLEGRLTSATGVPSNGATDIVLRLYDTGPGVGGTLLITDDHTTAGATNNPVTVTNGIYTIELGGGDLTAGSKATIGACFADLATVYLEMQVGAETLAPRTQMLSAAYALNADALDGRDSTYFATAPGSGAYVQLAPGAAQTWTTANSGVFLNETGAGTPSLLQLQVGGANTFVVGNTGAVTSGTWNGSTVTVPYGGTGGTTFTAGGVLYGDTANPLGVSAAGTSGSGVLLSGGAGAPTWGNSISGTLATQWNATTSANNGTGVRGISTNAAADGTGVYGSATAAGGSTHYGLYGIANGAAGNYGVWGTTSTNWGIGVYGQNTGTGNGSAVVGLLSGAATAGTRYAVSGQASGATTSGTNYGVFGITSGSTAGTANYGVSGDAGGAATTNYGVYGTATGATTNWAGYFAGNLALGGAATAPELRIYEATGSGTNYTAFKAQAQGGDVTYTLPASDTSGVLSSNGSGTLSWVDNMPSGDGDYIQNQSAGPQAASCWISGTAEVDGSVALGSTTGATFITQKVGTGNFLLDGAAGSTYTIGASTTTGTITIGGTAQTGTMTLGSSTGANTLAIANGSGATTLNLANAQTGGSANIGAAMTTGTITVGGTGAQTGAITIGPGTSTGAISIGSSTGTGTITLGGSSGARSINIGGTGANTIALGNTQTAGSVAMGNAMTGGTISIGGTGLQTGAITIGPGTSTGAITIGSSTGTGTITLGGSSGARSINIGGTGANTIALGNTQTAGSVAIGNAMTGGTVSIGGTGLQTGAITIGPGTSTGAISIGSSTGTGTITLGGSSGARSINIGGTGANTIAIGNTQTGGSIALGAALTTGTITVGGTTQTGNLTVGQSTASNTVNVGTGAVNGTTQTINIGTGAAGTGVETVSIGSTLNASSILLNAGTGAVTIGSGTAATELRFKEPSGSGANYTALRAQAQAGDVTYTLPASITASSLLTTDGSGNLSWTTSLPGSTTVPFNQISTGTNTTATMTVDTGASVVPSGTGIITATRMVGSGSTTNAVDLATAEVGGTLGVTNGGTGTSTQFTQGSAVFAGASGVYAQDNANFFWDDTNNRLGIGTSTPYASLHISGVPIVSVDERRSATLYDTTSGAQGVGGGISFGGMSDGASGYWCFANIKGIKENATLGDYASALVFSTRANGGNPTERMRISSGGNVNITSTLTIQGGTPGAGKVLTSDASGNATWGDNMPSGDADYIQNTTTAQTANYNVSNTGATAVAQITGTASGATNIALNVSQSTALGDIIHIDDDDNSSGEAGHYAIRLDTQGTDRFHVATNGDVYGTGDLEMGGTTAAAARGYFARSGTNGSAAVYVAEPDNGFGGSTGTSTVYVGYTNASPRFTLSPAGVVPWGSMTASDDGALGISSSSSYTGVAGLDYPSVGGVFTGGGAVGTPWIGAYGWVPSGNTYWSAGVAGITYTDNANSFGVYGSNLGGGANSWAGYFSGKVNVTGNLSVGGNLTVTGTGPYVLKTGDTMSGTLISSLAGVAYQMENTATLQAKNSVGTYETWMWPRWSDNNTYMNFGSGGNLYIRDNSSNNVGLFTTTGLLLGNDLYFKEDNTSGDPGYPWYRSDGNYAILNSSYGVSAANNYGLMLNWDNTDDISLCQGGGYVSIGAGATTPSALLEVRGNAEITGNLDMDSGEIDNAAYVDILAGVGYGVRFWSSDSYAINMGNTAEFQYGPVTDYSIKMNMNNQAGRGWTWGVDTLTPIAAIDTAGNMQIDGDLTVLGKNVGLGIAPSSTYLLYYNDITNPQQNGHYMYKTYDGTLTSYNLYNRSNDTGTSGTQYGIYNYADSSDTGLNTRNTYGMYNYAYNRGSGAGTIKGLYSYAYAQDEGGTKTVYGLQNYAYNYGRTSASTYGIYNYVDYPYGTGLEYGIYSVAAGYGSGSSYGIYARAYADNGGTAYGVYGVSTLGGASTLYVATGTGGGTWGTGWTNPHDPYNTYYHDSRSQSIYLASDLTAIGMTGGEITAIRLRCYEQPGRPTLANFRIRLKQTASTTLAAFDTAGLTLCFGPTSIANTSFTPGAWYTFTLSTPFTWDGTSNLLVEFSVDDVDWLDNGGMYVRTGLAAGRTFAGYADSASAWPFDTGLNTAQFAHVPEIGFTMSGGTGYAGYFSGDVNITGNLTKGSGSFVQPHAEKPDKQIVYAFFEGREHGIYHRGKARLVDGKAHIDLPEDFRVACSPESLTVHLTPRSPVPGLHVAEQGVDGIEVRAGPEGPKDAEFNYMVIGVRRYFEDHEPVQDNTLFRPKGPDDEEFLERIRGDGMTQRAMREMLVSNGILLPDGTINNELVRKLWGSTEGIADEGSGESPEDKDRPPPLAAPVRKPRTKD